MTRMRILGRGGAKVSPARAAAVGGPGGRGKVLFLNGATRSPLGADMWVLAQIIAGLDRATFEVHAACVERWQGVATPTYEALRSVPDVAIVPVSLGPELNGRSALGKVGAAAETLPAT